MTGNLEVELRDHDFHKFRKLIYELAGISLSDRKRELVKARLARRLRALDLESYGNYYDLLQDPQRGPGEIEFFINALTTNKTEFYRESHHFDYLKNDFLPALRMATLSGREKKVRIWCAASSTGQEPYTLALALTDYFGSQTDWDLRILASDIDTQVLSTATAGVYPEAELDPVPASLRSKFFVRKTLGDNTTYEARPELKRLLTFRQINLNEPVWPINIRFDAIFCRNVMIYFDQQTQSKLVEHFTQHLQPGGLLVIGHSESLFSITDDFDSLGETIYRVKPQAVSRSMARKKLPGDGGGKSTPPAKAAAVARPSQPAGNSMNNPEVDSRLAEYRDWPVKSLIVGEYEASGQPCILKTTVGSCIAACLYDGTNQVGGMNHFMLPQSRTEGRINTSYGVHAMELLINGLMRLGANRRKMIAKVFGGARVVDNLTAVSDVGTKNIEFVRQFLDTERIPVVGENVSGQYGRQIYFIPQTGKVLVRMLDGQASTKLDVDASQVQSRLLQNLNLQVANSVTMFS